MNHFQSLFFPFDNGSVEKCPSTSFPAAPVILIRLWRTHGYGFAGNSYLDIFEQPRKIEFFNRPYITKNERRSSLRTKARSSAPSNVSNLSLLELSKLTQTIDAPVVGFTCMGNNFPTALELAFELKEARPDTTILFGGPHVSLLGDKVLNAFPFTFIRKVRESSYIAIKMI